MAYPNSLQKLIERLKYLPGVGEKSAERFAFSILEMEEEKSLSLAKSIEEVPTKIHECKRCHTLTENELCDVCSDSLRDKEVLCVVEDTKSVFLFEKLGTYNGRYHVLEGLIDLSSGIRPEDIGLNELVDRIKQENYKEVILAFKPSIEGETTALYIHNILEGLPIKISRIASGIPMGADMEYIDPLTLERAFQDRKEIA